MRTFHCGLLAILSCAVITTTADSQTQTGACTTAKMRYITASAGGTTDSDTFVNFLANAVNFTQGGASASCVIVRFSTIATGSSGNVLSVAALLDGSTQGLPFDMPFSDGGDSIGQARSFDFIFPGVAPGNHSVRMKFRSRLGAGHNVSIGPHNIIVEYK